MLKVSHQFAAFFLVLLVCITSIFVLDRFNCGFFLNIYSLHPEMRCNTGEKYFMKYGNLREKNQLYLYHHQLAHIPFALSLFIFIQKFTSSLAPNNTISLIPQSFFFRVSRCVRGRAMRVFYTVVYTALVEKFAGR